MKMIYQSNKTCISLKDENTVLKTGILGPLEAEIQKKAYELGIAPKVYNSGVGFIEMEYIKGHTLDNYLKLHSTDKIQIKRLVRAAQDKLYNNGIDHKILPVSI